MLNLAEAHALIASHVHVLPPERVPLAEAAGRVLRESVATPEDIPAFHRSAFDGYALRAADAPGTLRITGEVPAGSGEGRSLATGEAMRIFTGGRLPAGADTVAMQEDCRATDGRVEIPAIREGHGVRRQAEDARLGEVLLPRGRQLGPVETSLLAQLGHVQPLVSPRLRVLHVATGEELVSPDQTPGPSQIRDSNSTLIAALVAQAGGTLVAQGRVGDERSAILEQVGRTEGWQLLLISGGASVGDYDFGRTALEELGFSVHFRALNLRPGKPLIFATRGRQLAFVLPGNPLSHFVCWHVAVQIAIQVATTGEATWDLVELKLGREKALPGFARETWWPVSIAYAGGHAWAMPMRWQSSGDLTRLAGVTGLLCVPSGPAGIAPGALASVRLL